MIDNRYNKVLTIVLVIVVIATIVAFGFWGFDIVQKHVIESSVEEFEGEFLNSIAEQTTQNGVVVDISNQTENTDNQVLGNVTEQPTNTTTNTQTGTTTTGGGSSNQGRTTNNNTSTNSIPLKYKGYDCIGWINIPRTNVSYPILATSTLSSMEVSVGWVFGWANGNVIETPSVNVEGNTVIYGHNYKNGTFFSNNKKLENGDEIYITSLNGEKVRYIIYNKYTTTSTDFDYATRASSGREISLSSCTDDSKSRIIIWAREG